MRRGLRFTLICVILAGDLSTARAFTFNTAFWKRRSSCPVNTCTTSTSSKATTTDTPSTEHRYETTVVAVFHHIFAGGDTTTQVKAETRSVPANDSGIQSLVNTQYPADLQTYMDNQGLRGVPQVFTDSTPTTETTYQTTVTGQQVVVNVTIETVVGPATIAIGDRDVGGTSFMIPSGQTNQNTNSETETKTQTETKTIILHKQLYVVTMEFFES